MALATLFFMAACVVTIPGALCTFSTCRLLHSLFFTVFSSSYSLTSSPFVSSTCPPKATAPAQTPPASNSKFEPYVGRVLQTPLELCFNTALLLHRPSQIAAFGRVDKGLWPALHSSPPFSTCVPPLNPGKALGIVNTHNSCMILTPKTNVGGHHFPNLIQNGNTEMVWTRLGRLSSCQVHPSAPELPHTVEV